MLIIIRCVFRLEYERVHKMCVMSVCISVWVCVSRSVDLFGVLLCFLARDMCAAAATQPHETMQLHFLHARCLLPLAHGTLFLNCASATVLIIIWFFTLFYFSSWHSVWSGLVEILVEVQCKCVLSHIETRLYAICLLSWYNMPHTMLNKT